MTTKYRLSYFPVMWLAEPARFIFALAGQTYEDHRFTSEDWKTLKPNTPLGQAPILSCNDTEISQSKAICRYLGRTFGLIAEDDFEAARGDMVVDYVDDLMKPLLAMFHVKDEEEKKKMSEKFVGETMVTIMGNYEKVLKENNGGDGFMIGDKVTWVDCYFAHFVDLIVSQTETEAPGCCQMDKYPKVKAYITRVLDLPAIKSWIAIRPKTPH